MNLRPRPTRTGSEKGMAATLLVVVIVVLLSALTAINTSTVRRARREADLLDSRQQRQWQRRGFTVPAPSASSAPSADTPVSSSVAPPSIPSPG